MAVAAARLHIAANMPNSLRAFQNRIKIENVCGARVRDFTLHGDVLNFCVRVVVVVVRRINAIRFEALYSIVELTCLQVNHDEILFFKFIVQQNCLSTCNSPVTFFSG